MTRDTDTDTDTDSGKPDAGAGGGREALVAERDFLLRSLDDLEAERAAGNLDDQQYRRLHDDYTARAAGVLRALEGQAPGDGAARPAATPKPPARRRFLVACALVGFAVVAAAVLASQMGDRAPGQTATGNQQSASGAKAELGRLRAAVAADPEDAAAHVALAQGLLGSGDVSGAIQEFDSAAKLDPKDAEAPAYGGWVVFLASRAAAGSTDADTTADLVEGALRRLDAAVAADPDYPDAHFFRGMVLMRGMNDAKAAVPEFERYLALVPEGPQVDQVKQLLEAARAAASSPAGK